MSETMNAQIDAAIRSGNRAMVVAAVLDWLIQIMARQDIGWLEQRGWSLALRLISKLRASLLDGIDERNQAAR